MADQIARLKTQDQILIILHSCKPKFYYFHLAMKPNELCISDKYFNH